MNDAMGSAQEYALVVQQAKRPPQAMMAHLRLMLNYLYGLEVLTAQKHAEVASMAIEYGADIRGVFLIQDEAILDKQAMGALSRRGQLPVVLLLPAAMAPDHEEIHAELPFVYVGAWERALGSEGGSLQAVLMGAFEAHRIPRLPIGVSGEPYDEVRERIRGHLDHISALPTLPDFVFRIMELLADPETNAEDVEKALTADPAVVLKIMQVVHSSAFAGARGEGEWSLREAIVRLGYRQVAAIAQQVSLVSALAKPLQSKFDMRRFWEHSVACAMIADRLVTGEQVSLPEPVDYNQYWIASLLHDLGKLLLGFVAYDYFDEVLGLAATRKVSFGEAEAELGHHVTHEYLGKLLLINAGATEALATAVSTHDTLGPAPGPLAALVHVATNLSQDMGLGYHEPERATYQPGTLAALGTGQEELAALAETLAGEMAEAIRELVEETALA